MMSTAQGWRPDFVPGELLSSFLVRLAARLGVTPHRLQCQFGKRFEIWTRDVDRSASDALVAAIAKRCDVSDKVVEAMTLRHYEHLLCRTNRASRQAGVATWINALGIFHRQRTLHGLQYCPACLQETPAFKQIWRLAFVTVCDKHVAMLCDSCRHCGTAIMPHRSRQAGLRCHNCNRLLGLEAPVDGTADQECVTIQDLFLDAARVGSTSFGTVNVGASDFFLGTSQLLQICKDKFVRRQDLRGILGQRFELSRTVERARYLSFLSQLLVDWPNRFTQFSATYNVSQNCFAHYKEIPAWVREVVLDLPKRIRSYRSRPLRLQCEGSNPRATSGNWRTIRARELLRAAGVKK